LCSQATAAITAATRVKPKVIGKPNREMMEGILRRTGVDKNEVCIIGDRLMTDIRMGRNFGILSILVLTGETTKEDLKHSRILPDLVIERNIDLLQYI